MGKRGKGRGHTELRRLAGKEGERDPNAMEGDWEYNLEGVGGLALPRS